MMKKFYKVTLILFITLCSLPTNFAIADEAADKAEFKKLYAEFNDLYQNSEAIDPVIEVAEKLYEIAPKAYGKNAQNTAVVTYNLASLYAEKGGVNNVDDFGNKAAKLLENYFSILDKTKTPKDETYIDQYLFYISVLASDGRLKPISKQAKYLRNLAIENNYAGVELAELEFTLGLYNYKNLDGLGSLKYFERSKELYEKEFGPDHINVGENSFWIAKIKMGLKNRRAAEENFLNALKVFEKNDIVGSDTSQSTHAFLVQLYEDMGQSDKATKHCQAVAVERPKDFDVHIDPIYRAVPEYPRSAANSGKEGWAVLEFIVDENGITNEVEIVSSSAKLFEKSSIEAASKSRYAPSVRNGKLVPTKGVRIKYEYSMVN